MINRHAALVCLVSVLACTSADGNDERGGTAVIAAPSFSADTAFAYLKQQVAFGPRVPGSTGHADQIEWMTGLLRARADSVIVQPFTHTHTSTGQTLQLTNVFARFNPQAGTRILLLAHYDTRPTADNDAEGEDQPILGANDGASGVAALLEIANILKREPPPIGVDLLFVDGEDYGPTGADMYLGARHFAANLPTGYKPLYGILLDMIADKNPRYLIEGNSQQYAPEVVERVWRMAEQLGYGNYFVRTNQGSIEDDHMPLNRAGIRTIDIIDFDFPEWHTKSDDLNAVAPTGLGVVGSVLVALIYRGG